MSAYTGRQVRCKTATGGSFETVARSEPFLNDAYIAKRAEPWEVIAVEVPGYDHPVNWPADDVELVDS